MPVMDLERKTESLERLKEVVAKLRSPEGCPWDREQTHKSLKKFLLNESYELFDAIDNDDSEHMKEELGDVLLQVFLHAQIASENKQFDVYDVADQISDKLIRRHPHVFSDTKVNSVNEVLQNWEQIKNEEKTERESVLDGIPKAMPALLRASEISKKAVAVGFEWPDEQMLWDTFYSEIDEIKAELAAGNKDKLSGEIGDLLFCIVNLSRWHGICPEMALQESSNKFTSRFQHMEQNTTKKLSDCQQPELEELWQNAKKELNEE